VRRAGSSTKYLKSDLYLQGPGRRCWPRRSQRNVVPAFWPSSPQRSPANGWEMVSHQAHGGALDKAQHAGQGVGVCTMKILEHACSYNVQQNLSRFLCTNPVNPPEWLKSLYSFSLTKHWSKCLRMVVRRWGLPRKLSNNTTPAQQPRVRCGIPFRVCREKEILPGS